MRRAAIAGAVRGGGEGGGDDPKNVEKGRRNALSSLAETMRDVHHDVHVVRGDAHGTDLPQVRHDGLRRLPEDVPRVPCVEGTGQYTRVTYPQAYGRRRFGRGNPPAVVCVCVCEDVPGVEGTRRERGACTVLYEEVEEEEEGGVGGK